MPDMDKPAVYQIKVRGEIDSVWSERLGGMQITVEPSDIVTLVGRLADQAALAGVLDTLYELHLPVLEVRQLEQEKR